MKIILSRKGFDSESGGYPSPILLDKYLISLPIPNPKDSIRYSDLKFDNISELKNNGLVPRINTYCHLMNKLKIKHIKYKKKRGEKSEWQPLETETKCHLDPDIRNEVLEDRNRMHMFGQSEIAQYHLDREKVEKGDLFLFFGRFQKTQITKDGKLKFDKKEPYLHIIFGYLHVEEKILLKEATEEQKARMKYQIHPHIKYNAEDYKQNTLYVASKSFSLNGLTFPGYGVLHCSKRGVLTHRNLSKPSCSKWDLPMEWFEKKNIKISYNKKSWKKDGEEKYFQSAARGQEFVIEAEDDYDVMEWAKKIICEGSQNYT